MDAPVRNIWSKILTSNSRTWTIISQSCRKKLIENFINADINWRPLKNNSHWKSCQNTEWVKITVILMRCRWGAAEEQLRDELCQRSRRERNFMDYQIRKKINGFSNTLKKTNFLSYKHSHTPSHMNKEYEKQSFRKKRHLKKYREYPNSNKYKSKRIHA